MAIFVDLEEEEEDRDCPHRASTGDDAAIEIKVKESDGPHREKEEEEEEEEAPETGLPLYRSAVTQAFYCYPIVIGIVSNIDLNTLDSLARSCREIHLGLLQYRSVLVRSTLRCCNEDLVPNPADADVFRMRAQARLHWVPTRRNAQAGSTVENNGKTGTCARDRVSECRRCGIVVCRNCTIKPPGEASLRDRHRRLCSGCTRTPLGTLTKPPLDPSTTLSSWTMKHHICQCESEGVHLCQPCGRSIRAADSDYARLWKWRIQYGEVLGGLGTGIGDGDRGVICGREADCLLARDREQELDSDAEDARETNLSSWDSSATADAATPDPAASSTGSNVAPPTTTFSSPSTPFTLTLVGGNYHAPYPPHTGPRASPAGPIDPLRNAGGSDPSMLRTSSPGYDRHEIQGIGGVLKKKRLRIVRVGACVIEREDEMARRVGVLSREVTGEARSWCGWCQRVIPGGKDTAEEGGSEKET